MTYISDMRVNERNIQIIYLVDTRLRWQLKRDLQVNIKEREHYRSLLLTS